MDMLELKDTTHFLSDFRDIHHRMVDQVQILMIP